VFDDLRPRLVHRQSAAGGRDGGGRLEVRLMLEGNAICEMFGCLNIAVGAAHAQWSVVDWVEYAMCDDHMRMCLEVLELRFVDDRPPVDVWATYWDIPERSHTHPLP
jgi:hypothetical protein